MKHRVVLTVMAMLAATPALPGVTSAQTSRPPLAECEGERLRTAAPPDIAALLRQDRAVRPDRLETALRDSFTCREPGVLVEILRTHGFFCGAVPWIAGLRADVCSINERRFLLGNARTSVRIESSAGLIRRITIAAILTDWF